MNLLITGGAGFIGGNLINYLLASYKFIKIINIDSFDPIYDLKLETVNRHAKKGKERYKHLTIDITNKQALFKNISLCKIDLIIHLAAKTGVRDSIGNTVDYISTNVEGTENILQLAKALKVPKLIFASSSSVYGNNPSLPWIESDLDLNPISPYASTKLAAEKLCQVYSQLYKMNIICLRFFTVYGPNQRPDLAIHQFYRLINNKQPIPFFGNGTTSRDYTYIDDIVSGIVKTMKYKFKGFDIFNLGNCKSISLNELVRTIQEVSGKNIKFYNLPLQEGDVNHTYASIEKAKIKLGYFPSTSLEEGLRIFNNWFYSRERKVNPT